MFIAQTTTLKFQKLYGKVIWKVIKAQKLHPKVMKSYKLKIISLNKF